MTTKTRIANKTIWALEDIIAATIDARTAWRTCHQIAMRRLDPLLLGNLAQISDCLARIETQARDARTGHYREDHHA